MGMYDEVKCNYPLPDNPPRWIKDAIFQTKDFDNVLEGYVITTQGRLMHQCKKYEYVEDKDAPFGGYMRAINEWEEDTEYHGDMVFYTGNVTARYKNGSYRLQEGTGEHPVFVEYKARFTEGQLQWIKRLDAETKRA